MSKYIDAEKIKYIEYINGDVTVSKEYIDEMEAADVAPVVHAHWINYVWCEECSNCRYKARWATDYCPYCGARMDGVSDDD